MCDMASQYELEIEKNKKLKEKIGTGCWLEGFGNIDMYFKNDIPIEDIDLSDIKREEIKNAVLKATDQIFKCIESMQKE